MAVGFTIWPRWEDRLRAAGIESAADALDRSRCVRDLPDRSNHSLHVGDLHIYLKRRKAGRWPRRSMPNPELDGLILGARLLVPVPPLVLAGEDKQLGALVGTLSLAPARPLDALLKEGTLCPDVRRRVLRRLADDVAALHASRHHHRDLYLNHVFVDPAEAQPVRGIIDWERHGAHRAEVGRWVVKDLASLLASIPPGTVSPREQRAFLARYMRAARVLRRSRAGLARRVEAKAARIRRHVPRTPVGEAARPRVGDAR